MSAFLRDHWLGLADLAFCLILPVVIVLWRSRRHPRVSGFWLGIVVGVLLAAGATAAVLWLSHGEASAVTPFLDAALQLAISLVARVLARLPATGARSGGATPAVGRSPFWSAVAAVTGWAALVRAASWLLFLLFIFSTIDLP